MVEEVHVLQVKTKICISITAERDITLLEELRGVVADEVLHNQKKFRKFILFTNAFYQVPPLEDSSTGRGVD